MGGVHPSTGVEDAIAQLDTRIPLLHSERKLIVESLYDLAFREGASQGRRAGVEHVQNKLREEALSLQYAPGANASTVLLDLALALNPAEPHGEYEEPGQALRDRLAQLKRR